MAVHHIPDGYHSVTPYLIIDGAARALEFYTKAFGATEIMRMPDPSGRIGHAEMKIGDSHIMLADEHLEMGFRGPKSVGGTPVSIMIYVEDADARFNAAIAAGATEMKPLANQFYGDRSGSVIDPFGHIWHIATHVEDVPPEEMERRAKEYMEKQGA
jgi:PhnB protein